MTDSTDDVDWYDGPNEDEDEFYPDIHPWSHKKSPLYPVRNNPFLTLQKENMSNELVSKDFTPEQMHLITSTIAKGATPDELKLFLYRCANLGLDPLKPGQIYFIKYGSGPGTIVVGIDGFRARAAKTGKLAGIKRGSMHDDKGQLIGAYAEVFRSDWKECAREEVPLQEYNTGKGNWQKMPETMIKKVAEAAALRMAFPDDLGGVYEAAEMDQAEARTVRTSDGKALEPIRIEQPPADGGDGIFTPGNFAIPIGKKWKGTKLKDMPLDELKSFIAYLEDSAAKDGKPLGRGAQDIVDYGTEYILSVEQMPIDNEPLPDFGPKK